MNMLINATPQQTMSSREIAELTGKRHDNVMRTIRDLIADQILTPQIEESTFEHAGNTYKCFLLNKRDSLVVVARLSPEFTAAVIDRWQELEAKQVTTFDITNPLHLLQAIEVQARLNIQLAAERDQAIATKAQIGNAREATAMATASAAVRKANNLKRELGRHTEVATVKAVHRMTNKTYDHIVELHKAQAVIMKMDRAIKDLTKQRDESDLASCIMCDMLTESDRECDRLRNRIAWVDIAEHLLAEKDKEIEALKSGAVPADVSALIAKFECAKADLRAAQNKIKRLEHSAERWEVLWVRADRTLSKSQNLVWFLICAMAVMVVLAVWGAAFTFK